MNTYGGKCKKCWAQLDTGFDCPNGCDQSSGKTSHTTVASINTGCHECDFYRQQYKNFCANCGRKIIQH